MTTPTRVMFLTNSLGTGGAERVIVTLANAFADAGWSVTIVTIEPTDDAYAVHPAVQRLRLALSAPSRSLVGALAANAWRVRAVRDVLRTVQPDVAVAFLTSCNVLLALARRGTAVARCIGAERVHPPQYPLGRVWEWLRAHCYGGLDLVVAQTHETKVWLQSHTNARAVAIIPNPVSWPLPVREPVRAPERVGRAGRRRLLAVGRLHKQKGFDLLIAAFAPLAAAHPDWELVILGEGPERVSLTRQIEQAGASDAVMLAGAAGNVGTWLEQADAFVLPSRFEGFPNALAEAMAYGRAVVSFDCDTGPRDLITHERDGLLVPVRDGLVLQAALARVMGDADLRERLGAAAIGVRERFSIERVRQLWTEAVHPTVAA